MAYPSWHCMQRSPTVHKKRVVQKKMSLCKKHMGSHLGAQQERRWIGTVQMEVNQEINERQAWRMDHVGSTGDWQCAMWQEVTKTAIYNDVECFEPNHIATKGRRPWKSDRNATTNHMHMEAARGTNLQALKNQIVRKSQKDARHIIQIIFQATKTACSLQHWTAQTGAAKANTSPRLVGFLVRYFNRGLVHDNWMHSSSSNILSPTMTSGFPYDWNILGVRLSSAGHIHNSTCPQTNPISTKESLLLFSLCGMIDMRRLVWNKGWLSSCEGKTTFHLLTAGWAQGHCSTRQVLQGLPVKAAQKIHDTKMRSPKNSPGPWQGLAEWRARPHPRSPQSTWNCDKIRLASYYLMGGRDQKKLDNGCSDLGSSDPSVPTSLDSHKLFLWNLGSRKLGSKIQDAQRFFLWNLGSTKPEQKLFLGNLGSSKPGSKIQDTQRLFLGNLGSSKPGSKMPRDSSWEILDPRIQDSWAKTPRNLGSWILDPASPPGSKIPGPRPPGNLGSWILDPRGWNCQTWERQESPLVRLETWDLAFHKHSRNLV